MGLENMKILGLEFAPLHVPRRLQTLSAATWFITFAYGAVISIALASYLLFFTRLWWLMLLYIAWIYLDKDTCEKGGRPSKWVQNWTWWRYFRDYFPLRLAVVPQATFDAKKNYLFCYFPHGVLPIGGFNAFATDSKEYHQLFPNHQPVVAALPILFHVPFSRELSFSLGLISCSSKSLSYMLKKSEGGHFVNLAVGGAVEAFNSQPGKYKIILKNRKGFVKLALKTGSPLVPVFSFGETDAFEQVEGPTVHRVQEYIRGVFGVAPVIVNGVIPRRAEMTVLVGRPVEVYKVQEPTHEQIEELHEKFTMALKNMFEEYKYKYLKNPKDTFLEIE